MVARYGASYPSAMKCLTPYAESLTAYPGLYPMVSITARMCAS
jgi:hypothetical protein